MGLDLTPARPCFGCEDCEPFDTRPLDRPPAALSALEAGRLQRSMCGRKARLTRRGAMAAARRARAGGVPLSAYPCPFCGADERCFWHVGHAPAMATVELLARYLRFGSEQLSDDASEIGAS